MIRSHIYTDRTQWNGSYFTYYWFLHTGWIFDKILRNDT